MYEIKVVVFNILNTTLDIYKWIVIISAFISFVNPDRRNPIVKILNSLTEPVYKKIRSVIPTIYYNIDFAPLVVLFIIYVLQAFVLPLLLR